LFFNKQKSQISIKIGDFGNSRKIKNYLKSLTGTPLYQSPEMVSNQAYNEKTDVW
jgi:NIMA (never in mitosis gene a)-related kinase